MAGWQPGRREDGGKEVGEGGERGGGGSRVGKGGGVDVRLRGGVQSR